MCERISTCITFYVSAAYVFRSHSALGMNYRSGVLIFRLSAYFIVRLPVQSRVAVDELVAACAGTCATEQCVLDVFCKLILKSLI